MEYTTGVIAMQKLDVELRDKLLQCRTEQQGRQSKWTCQDRRYCSVQSRNNLNNSRIIRKEGTKIDFEAV
jgi:hypothetical protein